MQWMMIETDYEIEKKSFNDQKGGDWVVTGEE